MGATYVDGKILLLNRRYAGQAMHASLLEAVKSAHGDPKASGSDVHEPGCTGLTWPESEYLIVLETCPDATHLSVGLASALRPRPKSPVAAPVERDGPDLWPPNGSVLLSPMALARFVGKPSTAVPEEVFADCEHVFESTQCRDHWNQMLSGDFSTDDDVDPFAPTECKDSYDEKKCSVGEDRTSSNLTVNFIIDEGRITSLYWKAFSFDPKNGRATDELLREVETAWPCPESDRVRYEERNAAGERMRKVSGRCSVGPYWYDAYFVYFDGTNNSAEVTISRAQ